MTPLSLRENRLNRGLSDTRNLMSGIHIDCHVPVQNNEELLRSSTLTVHWVKRNLKSRCVLMNFPGFELQLVKINKIYHNRNE